MIQAAEKLYTVEEYFELEKKSDIRHEYVYGKLIAMSGETKIANKIAGNCYKFFDNTLNNDVFETFIHDVKLMVDTKLYRYPDLVIVPVTDDTDPYATTQPILIIEVLSDSTESIDRGDKLRQYSNLPSLQYYLLLSQTEPVVEIYTREGNRWILEFFTSLEDVIPLSALETTLSLQSIYKRIKFSK